MNLSRDDSCALNIWQRLHFDTDSLKNPSTRADAWRRLLLQLRISRNSNRISSQLYTRLLRVLATNYCQITDNQDPSQGLNNFAEAVLTLASGCQNESQNWCSGLSLSNVQNLPIYKSLVAKDPLGDQKTRKPLQSNFDGSQSTVSALSSSENRLYDQTAVIREGNAVNDKMSVTEPNFTAHFSAKFEKSDTNSFEKHSQTFSSAGVLLNTVYQHQRELSIDSIPQNSENFRSIVLGSESDRGIKQQRTDAFSNCSNSRFKSNAGIKRKAENPFSDGSGVNGVSSHLNAEQKSYGPGTFSNTGSTFVALDNNKNSPPVHDPTHQLNANQLTTRPIYLEKCGDKRFSRKAPDMQSCSDDDHDSNAVPNFITARQQLMINSKKKNHHHEGAINSANYGSTRKTLGTRRGPSRQFVPPVINHSQNNDVMERELNNDVRTNGEPEVDERLKNIDPKMIELIRNEIMDHGPPLSWDDIAGLEFAKSVIKEIVVWPMLRPDIFKGLRGPPKGVLLFGPPGTGKTLIGKCIASQSKATFFSISASSLTSKWVGEGEKMVRALFAVARCHLPAVIFIDEIDSLLSQRTDGEHDASRRIKTEFLVQLDGATTNSDDRLLVVGATNRPQEIDEAARRRLVKRLYIPLPDAGAREQIISSLLSQQKCSLSGQEIRHIVERTQGYSGSDMANLCREAALGPIRSISDIQCIDADQVPPIVFKDFDAALHQVRASVSEKDLNLYTQWNKLYGSGSK